MARLPVKAELSSVIVVRVRKEERRRMTRNAQNGLFWISFVVGFFEVEIGMVLVDLRLLIIFLFFFIGRVNF